MPRALRPAGSAFVSSVLQGHAPRAILLGTGKDIQTSITVKTFTSLSRSNLATREQARNLFDTFSPHRPHRRFQHDNQSPHKEYFQTPGQAPKPDLSPYRRSESVTTPPAYPPSYPGNAQAQYAYSQPGSPTSTPFTPESTARGSILWRTIRYISSVSVFSAFGIIGGTALITWEYLSPLAEAGSEEETELLEEIREIMEDHNLIVGLREDGWKEVNLDVTTNPGVVEQGVVKGRSMVYQVLTGTKGIVGPKLFYHPVQEYTVLVFFTGFGIEGWPDVVHGGIITTLLEEGAHKHVEHFYGGDRGQAEKTGEVGIKVDFKKPVKPGSMYAVLIPPAVREEIRSSPDKMGLAPTIRTNTDRLKMVAIFLQMDGAPKVSSNVRVGTNMVEHKIDIPNHGGRDGDNIYAVAEISMKVPGQNRETSFWSDLEQQNASIIGRTTKGKDEKSP